LERQASVIRGRSQVSKALVTGHDQLVTLDRDGLARDLDDAPNALSPTLVYSMHLVR
jgi:hypothetical protein